jgi:hypothetical protein
MTQIIKRDFDVVDLDNIGNCSIKQRDRNDRHYQDDRTNKYVDQCAVCFKGIKSYDNAYTTIGDGNPLSLTKRSQHHIVEKSGGYMGCYYLGPECGRQAKKLLKEKGLDWKDWLGHRTNNKELFKTELKDSRLC